MENWVLLTVWKLGICLCRRTVHQPPLPLGVALSMLSAGIATLALQVNALQREMAAADTQYEGKKKKKKGFTGALR